MIHHDSGAYIQIDSKGTVSEKAAADRYEINIGTKHESSGHSVVTLMVTLMFMLKEIRQKK